MTETPWFYLDGDVRRGPFSFHQIKEAFQAGTLTLDTRVWREGMDTPQPIGQVAEMATILKPDPVPVEEVRSARPTRAAPWSRFVARHIDLMLYQLPLVLVFYVSADAAAFLEDITFGLINRAPGGMLIFVGLLQLSVLLLLGLIIDALVIAWFGTTLGKWIFRLSVRGMDGSKVPLSGLIQRSFGIWIHGYALMVPLLNLWFLWRSYCRAAESQRCRWDEPRLLIVEQQPIGRGRWSVGLAVLIVLGFARADYSDHVSWSNPVTQVRLQLPRGWAPTSSPDQAAKNIFIFQSNQARIVVALETVPNLDLGQYAERLKQNSNMGIYGRTDSKVDARGVRYLEMTFSKTIDGIEYDRKARVWYKSPDTYWTILLQKPAGNTQAQNEAEELAGHLALTLPLQ